MQLKNKKSIRSALATATCTLLGTNATDAMALGTDAPWEFDSAVLLYSEEDRVSAFEPVFKARKELDDKEFINLRIVIDVLTGASASGAVPMPFQQTFTSPSGNNVYTTPANETPLDDTFKDTRVALSADWEKPINPDLNAVYGAYFSREYDYLSLGGSATFSLDTNNKNTTYTGGVSLGLDRVEPVGGTPVGMTEMPDFPTEKTTKGSSENKTVVDLLFGVTQVLSRKSLLQINYTLGSISGYLTDPYKLLSVIDDTPGPTYGQIINQGAADGYSYRHENRPDSRLSHAIYAKYVHQFNEDVINFSYRYFFDDWGITSHTFDVRYRFEIGGGHYLQPHVRYYTQTEADFYQPFLLDSEDESVTEASADYRLGELVTTTFGLLYGIEFSKTQEFTFRAELMNQSVDEPSNKFGALNSQDLSTDLDAYILQVGYSFQW